MVVRTRASETHQLVRVPVASREAAEVRDDLHLGDAVGQIERPIESDGLGDLVEQLVQAGDADRAEHLAHVVVGLRREPHPEPSV